MTKDILPVVSVFLIALAVVLVAMQIRGAVTTWARESRIEKCFEQLKNMECAK